MTVIRRRTSDGLWEDIGPTTGLVTTNTTQSITGLKTFNDVVVNSFVNNTSNEAPLKNFRQALATVSTTPCDILSIGASVDEGYFAVTDEDRYIAIVRRELQSRFNPAGIVGGEGYIPARHVAGNTVNGFASQPQRWTYGGGWALQGNWTYGVGRRYAMLDAAAETATITVFGDMFSIYYLKGTSVGSFTVTVDGSLAATVDAYDTVLSTGVYNSAQLTRGNHTIVLQPTSGSANPVTGTRVLGLDGIMVYDGDYNAGVRWWDAGHSGYAASDFNNTTWMTALSSINPDLITINFGGNEMLLAQTSASFDTNLRGLITKLRAAVSTTPSIVLYKLYDLSTTSGYSPIEPWANYEAVIHSVAKDMGCAILDFGERMPAAGGTGGSPLYAENIHVNPAGMRAMASEITAFLVDERPSLSSKFVTIDSAQTVTGNKVFRSNSTFVAQFQTTSSSYGAFLGIGRNNASESYIGTHGADTVSFTDGANGDTELVGTFGTTLRLGLLGSGATATASLLRLSSSGVVSNVNLYEGANRVYSAGNAPPAPSNMMTTDSTQTGLTGDKTSSGNWIATTLRASGLSGATSTFRIAGATTSGAPSSGTWSTGDVIFARNGVTWICSSGGSPGTWQQQLSSANTSQTFDGSKTFTSGLTAAVFSATGATGATDVTYWGGGTTSGAPSSGTWSSGTMIIAKNGRIWICTSGGSPGTWVDAGSSTETLASSIIDAKGDLIVGTGDNTPVRQVIGNNNEVLMADSGQTNGLKWGKIVAASLNTTGTPDGTKYLRDDMAWTTFPTETLPVSIINAKGDLIVGTSPDVASVLSVGTNDRVLIADSGQSSGLKWDFLPAASLAAGILTSGTWTLAGGSLNMDAVLYMNPVLTATSGNTVYSSRAITMKSSYWTGSAAATGSADLYARAVSPSGTVTVTTDSSFSALSVTAGSFGAGLSRYIGGANNANPTGGPWLQGDAVIDRQAGTWRICTIAGSPGTWEVGVTVGGVQSITGAKTFTSLLAVEKSAPSTPASGVGEIYVLSTDSRPYFKNDGGEVFSLINTEPYIMAVTGNLTVQTGKSRVYLEGNYVIESIRASVGTASTGADIIVDVNLNGTTIYGTQSNRPTITAGSNTALGGAPTSTSVSSGQYLTVDVDQIGSTIAGADLTVVIRLRRV